MIGANTKVIHPKDSKVGMEQRKQSLATGLESLCTVKPLKVLVMNVLIYIYTKLYLVDSELGEGGKLNKSSLRQKLQSSS